MEIRKNKRKTAIPGEDFIQWVWQHIHFDLHNVQTAGGMKLEIMDPGKLNETDGPDFKRAHLVLDGLELFGSVEIHLNEQCWYAHQHHQQESYNQVILHVVLWRQGKQACRKDGTPIPTLELFPLLPGRLQQLVQSFSRPNHLPCHHLIQHISPEIVEQQLAKARQEYFEYKVQQFGAFADPDLPPTQAWKKALIIALFESLGISNNRAPMRRLAQILFPEIPAQTSYRQIYRQAKNASGLFEQGSQPAARLAWTFKGSRPANHPRRRIQQASALAARITETDPANFLQSDPDIIWNRWLNFGNSPGKQRSTVMYGTVYIPGIYYLGMLGHSATLKTYARDKWNRLHLPIPKSLRKWFAKTGISPALYDKNPGYIHQIKRYCKNRKCSECFMLKSAISS